MEADRGLPPAINARRLRRAQPLDWLKVRRVGPMALLMVAAAERVHLYRLTAEQADLIARGLTDGGAALAQPTRTGGPDR